MTTIAHWADRLGCSTTITHLKDTVITDEGKLTLCSQSFCKHGMCLYKLK